MRIDLHSHSSASDGSFTPREVARTFAAAGIDIAALTDHDTLGGLSDFLAECESAGITGLGGIEFSTVYRDVEVHLLGYRLPVNDPRFKKFMESHYAYLRARCAETLKKLSGFGYEIDIDELYITSKGNPPMSPHILRHLFAKGKISDLKQAVDFFWVFLSNTGKAWVPHETPVESPVRMLREVGAISIVAHPVRLPDTGRLEEILDMGADGFELFYPEQDGDLFEELSSTAGRRGCMVTGGSDYHGAFHKVQVGEASFDPEQVDKFLEAAGIDFKSLSKSEGRKTG